MTMQLDDAFKLMKRPEMVNPDRKKRMHFWFSPDGVLILDKVKVSNGDILAANKGKPPKPPFAIGRLSLCEVEGSRELRVATRSPLASKLAKALKVEAPKHGLRVPIVIEETADDEENEAGQEAAAEVTDTHRLLVQQAAQALLQRKPKLQYAVQRLLQQHLSPGAISSDEAIKVTELLAKLELTAGSTDPEAGKFADLVSAAAGRARDRRPDLVPQIQELVRRALAAAKDGRDDEAQQHLAALNAMWDQSVTQASGEGGSFEQKLLAAAQVARQNQPEQKDRITELVMQARTQHQRDTEESRQKAMAALAELRLMGGTVANPRAATDIAVKALKAAVADLKGSLEKGLIPKNRSPQLVEIESRLQQARDLLADDPDASLARTQEAMKLLRQLEQRHDEARARQEREQGVSKAVQGQQAVQRHVDKLTSKKGGLLSDYEVAQELGRGANGSVSLLKSKSGGPTLVVKSPIEGGILSLQDLTEDLQREAQLSRTIGAHPNIAQCYGVMTVGDKPGLLMEAVAGGDMRNLNRSLLDRRNSGEMSEEEYWGSVQFTFAKTLEALAFVAEKGYVHGDIKPENIMIDAETGEPKLIDLGSMAQIGQRAGNDSAAYRAPEFDINATTGRDTFGVGATLYEVGQGNTGKVEDSDKRFDFGGRNAVAGSQNWGKANQTVPDDWNSVPQDWRALAEPPLKVVDNVQEKAFDEEVETDDDDDPVSSKAVKKKGVYAANSAYVDFVSRLMHPNPAMRLSPQEALKHPFMQQRLLDDDKAKALIKGVVAPEDPEETPLDKQAKALEKQSSAVQKASGDALERAGKLDKLTQAVQAEVLQIASGRNPKRNAALADDKLTRPLDESSQRLGALADAALQLARDAEALEKLTSNPANAPKDNDAKGLKAHAKAVQAHTQAAKLAGEGEEARRTLLAATTRLTKAMKERRDATAG